MENVKGIKEPKNGWSKETIELIEIAREIVRVSRKIREEEEKAKAVPADTKEETAYEKVAKINPYLSKYDTVFYY